MATRDLSYLIDFSVQGAEELTTATQNMENLATATGEIDEGTHTVDIEVPETLSTDLDTVGTSLDGVGTKADDAKGKGDLLESTMGKVAAGALIVGEAIDIAGQFVEIGTQLWEAYRAKQDETERITRAVSDAILEQSGALDIAAGELEDVIANAETADEILNASIWEGIEAADGAAEIDKIRTALLDVGLTFDDLGPTIVAFEDGAGTAIGDVFAGNAGNVDLFLEAVSNAPTVLGQLGPALQGLRFEDFAAAVGDAVQGADSFESAMIGLQQAGLGDVAVHFEDQIRALEQLDDAQENVDYGTLIEQTFAAAESSETLRGVLDSVRTDLGPDASEFEVWTEYIARLQEVQGAAEGTDAAIDAAAAPRTGEFDVELEDARVRAAELSGELDAVAAPRSAIVTAEADTAPMSEQILAAADAAPTATIVADADTAQAADDLLDETSQLRTATINAEAETLFADVALDVFTNQIRTAEIGTDANLTTAANELAGFVNQQRTATIDAAIGSVPSAQSFVNAIGPIRVPIQLYYNQRIEGNRPI